MNDGDIRSNADKSLTHLARDSTSWGAWSGQYMFSNPRFPEVQLAEAVWSSDPGTRSADAEMYLTSI